MFELIVKSSKDVKKITINFGDENATINSIEPSLPEQIKSEPAKDMSDILNERAAKSTARSARKQTESALPEINKDRPPLVDDGFASSF